MCFSKDKILSPCFVKWQNMESILVNWVYEKNVLHFGQKIWAKSDTKINNKKNLLEQNPEQKVKTETVEKLKTELVQTISTTQNNSAVGITD